MKITFFLILGCLASAAQGSEAKFVVGGVYKSFFKDPKTSLQKEKLVKDFYLDVNPVTNSEFLEFTKKNPQWRQDQIPRLFAEQGYLSHWKGPDLFDIKIKNWPVTQVSWFAARAYCKAQGKRLPLLAEWEWAADSSGASEAVLNWYGDGRMSLKDVSDNGFTSKGIKHLHGLVWEWVEDFNSVMIPNRGDRNVDKMFCGAGALGSADATQYATFLRFGFRSSLRASYTLYNLGFRCAKKGGE